MQATCRVPGIFSEPARFANFTLKTGCSAFVTAPVGWSGWTGPVLHFAPPLRGRAAFCGIAERRP